MKIFEKFDQNMTYVQNTFKINSQNGQDREEDAEEEEEEEIGLKINEE